MKENLNVSLSEILTKTDSFGITLLFFLLQKMDNYNHLYLSTESIAKSLNTTRPRVDRYRRNFEKVNILNFIPNFMFVNPSLFWKGNEVERSFEIERYNYFREHNKILYD